MWRTYFILIQFLKTMSWYFYFFFFFTSMYFSVYSTFNTVSIWLSFGFQRNTSINRDIFYKTDKFLENISCTSFTQLFRIFSLYLSETFFVTFWQIFQKNLNTLWFCVDIQLTTLGIVQVAKASDMHETSDYSLCCFPYSHSVKAALTN